MEYEKTFVAFLDFLGFSEASRELDETARLKVLDLLRALVALRSEFSADSKQETDGSKKIFIKPAISTFSDNIVISFDLETVRKTAGINDTVLGFIVLGEFERLVSIIAAQALRLGFLIRGGARVGRLYHEGGVVFGEALVEAVELERHTAVYPRVVLSAAVGRAWSERMPDVIREDDGIYCVNYIGSMMLNAALPGDEFRANIKRWFDEVSVVIQQALVAHARNGRLNELAKWTWFAKRFRARIESAHPELIKLWGISVENITWGT
jgi:hypothetical protein